MDAGSLHFVMRLLLHPTPHSAALPSPAQRCSKRRLRSRPAVEALLISLGSTRECVDVHDGMANARPESERWR